MFGFIYTYYAFPFHAIIWYSLVNSSVFTNDYAKPNNHHNTRFFFCTISLAIGKKYNFLVYKKKYIISSREKRLSTPANTWKICRRNTHLVEFFRELNVLLFCKKRKLALWVVFILKYSTAYQTPIAVSNLYTLY